MDPASQYIEQQILAFRESLENPLKTGSSLPIDTAVRYTEGLINYTYADVFSRDSVAGSVTFGVISGFGYGSPISYGSFGEEDWWMFGWAQYNNGGYCGESEYAGTHIYDDAAGQIERRIRMGIGVPANRKSAIDVVTLEIWPEGLVRYVEGSWFYYCDLLNYEDENPHDNLYDYLIMGKISNYPNFDPCLNPQEMNFYLKGSDDVSRDLLFECEDISNLITGKTFMSITISGNNTNTTPYYWYMHQLTNVYGIWIVNPNQPETWN